MVGRFEVFVGGYSMLLRNAFASMQCFRSIIIFCHFLCVSTLCNGEVLLETFLRSRSTQRLKATRRTLHVENVSLAARDRGVGLSSFKRWGRAYSVVHRLRFLHINKIVYRRHGLTFDDTDALILVVAESLRMHG